MKKNIFKISILLLGLLLLFSCYKQDEYPIIPQIDFTQVVIKDTVDELLNQKLVHYIYFKVLDGDGNFGLKKDDTIIDFYGDSLYANNFFATLYYLYNGQVLEYPMQLKLFSRIPYSNPISVTKYYKSLVIFKSENASFIPYPIKYSFYVIDRDLNKSNVQSTPWIYPNASGILTDSTIIIPD